jgi:hypothetical protein
MLFAVAVSCGLVFAATVQATPPRMPTRSATSFAARMTYLQLPIPGLLVGDAGSRNAIGIIWAYLLRR